MVTAGIVAVIPMKPPRLGKSRLAGRLTPSERATLSLNMLEGVVDAFLKAAMRRVWVLGGDDTVQRTATDLGAQWCDDNGADLNDALADAFDRAFAVDLAPMYLSADLPFIASDDVRRTSSSTLYASSRSRRNPQAYRSSSRATGGPVATRSSSERPGWEMATSRYPTILKSTPW